MRHLSRKKHWLYVKIRHLHHFMCSIIIISFRKVQTSVLWYRVIGERSTPAWEEKPPFFSHIPNVYIYIYIDISVHFAAQFTSGNQKILLKTKIYEKGILGNNYLSPRSQKNHRILEKLSLKTFFGPKLGLNCHHGLKGHSQILT